MHDVGETIWAHRRFEALRQGPFDWLHHAIRRTAEDLHLLGALISHLCSAPPSWPSLGPVPPVRRIVNRSPGLRSRGGFNTVALCPSYRSPRWKGVTQNFQTTESSPPSGVGIL